MLGRPLRAGEDAWPSERQCPRPSLRSASSPSSTTECPRRRCASSAQPRRRLYLLEANFPCYYAQAQLKGGVDVAGAMVDYLLSQAGALGPPSAEPAFGE